MEEGKFDALYNSNQEIDLTGRTLTAEQIEKAISEISDNETEFDIIIPGADMSKQETIIDEEGNEIPVARTMNETRANMLMFGCTGIKVNGVNKIIQI